MKQSKVVKVVSMVLFGAVAILLSGCASIVHGTTQEETFRSIPRGAHVKIDGRYFGDTPVTAKLSRKKVHQVEVNLPGYQPANFELQQHVSGWYFGNIVFGGLIGIVVDYADGAIYVLEPSQLQNYTGTKLQPHSDNTVTVIMAHNVAPRYRGHKIGQLKKRAPSKHAKVQAKKHV